MASPFFASEEGLYFVADYDSAFYLYWYSHDNLPTTKEPLSSSELAIRRFQKMTAKLPFPIILKCELSQSTAILLFYDTGNAFPGYQNINLQSLYRGMGVSIRAQVPMMDVLGFDSGMD